MSHGRSDEKVWSGETLVPAALIKDSLLSNVCDNQKKSQRVLEIVERIDDAVHF